jgi:4'-phosphopantetheinyl transferase
VPETLWDRVGPEALLATLSGEERVRAGRLMFDEDHRGFVAAHYLARTTLAEHLARAPRAIAFRRGEGGRPELADPDAELSFNISHTRGLVACAVARGAVVGVDAEPIRHLPDVASLAARVMTRAERERLTALPAGRRSEAFLRVWTAKEAYAKATGKGLSLPLPSVAIDAEQAPGAVLCARTGDPLPGVGLSWHDAGPDHLLAIALIAPTGAR